MEWIIGGIFVIGVIALAQLVGNKAASDSWQVLPLAGRSKVAPADAPSALQIATLTVGSRIVAFIAPSANLSRFIQANFVVTVGPIPDDPQMLVTASFDSVVWYPKPEDHGSSEIWLKDDPIPQVGTLFHIPATYIDHVYDAGDKLHTATPPVL